MFKTLDTHKIFYDAEGRPISDIVSISLQTSKIAYKDRASTKPKENTSTALSLYLFFFLLFPLIDSISFICYYSRFYYL